MNINEQLITKIVMEVLAKHNGVGEKFAKHVGAGGVAVVRGGTVKPEPFDTGKAGDKVFLLDVLKIEESPRLGCGFMEMDHSGFDWHLEYDEIDYVIEGTLEIIINGETISGSAGDVLYIPKGSSIKFNAPGKVRFMYVTYPANWSEQ